MGKKSKENQVPDNLLPKEDAFFRDDEVKAFYSDPNNFIDDTPYIRPINEKFDEDGLYLMQHLVICHLAIQAGYFPDDRFPNTKDKCFQYYKDRNLFSVQVKPDTFYKAYSRYLEIDFENGHRVIPREKYLRADFIEKIIPFIEQWYPDASVLVITLNTSPHIFKPIHYYWIYREVRDKFRGSMEGFRMEYCAHIKYETFRTFHKRNSKKKTPAEIKGYITPFIEFHFSNESETD